MYIYHECPDCESEIYKKENEFYVCQQCGHKIPIPEIKTVSPDELFVKEKKKRPLYYQLMSSGLNSLLLGILYVLGIIIYEYVKNGNFSPFEEGSFVVPFIFVLGLIGIALGIILFLIGVILKYCSKK